MKRLYRSRKDKKIAGICGGIAAYFNVDATLVRVAAVLLILVGVVPAVVAYGIMWVIMPEEP